MEKAGLGGTSWRLVQFQGNRLTGSYEVKGDRLTFRETASTMMACIEGMDIEKAFVDALPQVKTWRIEGRELEFFDDAGKMLARFETRR